MAGVILNSYLAILRQLPSWKIDTALPDGVSFLKNNSGLFAGV